MQYALLLILVSILIDIYTIYLGNVFIYKYFNLEVSTLGCILGLSVKPSKNGGGEILLRGSSIVRVLRFLI